MPDDGEKKNDPPDQRELLDLANTIVLLFAAMSSPISAWAIPLYDPHFDNQPELRNKLFTLMMSGLIDTAWEYENRLTQLHTRAEKIGSPGAGFWLGALYCMIAQLVDVLEQLTASETAYIVDWRNQLVHGEWREMQKSRTIYYAQNGRIERKRFENEEFLKFIETIPVAPDKAVEPLRERVLKYKTLFWSIERVLNNQMVAAAIRNDVLLGSNFKEPSFQAVIPMPNQPYEYEKDKRFRSFYDLGKILFAQLPPR